MQIRVVRHEDAEAIDRVVMGAFGEEGEVVRSLVHALRAEDLQIDELCFVAIEEGEVVGYVGMGKMTLSSSGGSFDILMLTPLAVEPEFQGQGIGRALVEAAVAGAECRPEPLLFVEGWKDGRSVYARYFDSPPPEMTPPPEAFMVEACQVRKLPSFDPELHRGHLVYPEPVRLLDHQT
jgi:putative acetyltransferase